MYSVMRNSFLSVAEEAYPPFITRLKFVISEYLYIEGRGNLMNSLSAENSGLSKTGSLSFKYE